MLRKKKCLRSCIWRLSAVPSVRIHAAQDEIARRCTRALQTHIADMRIARHYERTSLQKHTTACVFDYLGNQNRKRSGWWIHTMSSVTEPLNDTGADGLNEELPASMNSLALNAPSS